MNATKLVPSTGPKKPPNAGKGRKPGSQNKVPKALKEMILGALDRAGGEDYLLQQAHDNPTTFLGLIGKILPSELAVSAMPVPQDRPMGLIELYQRMGTAKKTPPLPEGHGKAGPDPVDSTA